MLLVGNNTNGSWFIKWAPVPPIANDSLVDLKSPHDSIEDYLLVPFN